MTTFHWCGHQMPSYRIFQVVLLPKLPPNSEAVATQLGKEHNLNRDKVPNQACLLIHRGGQSVGEKH